MNFRACLVIFAGLASLSCLTMGCGGAALDYGQERNLEEVKPNFVNPPWYDDYADDPSQASKKYRKKVLQADVTISSFEEHTKGVVIHGATGDSERYRITCLFRLSAGNQVQGFSPGDQLTVKGLFDHIDDAASTYEIHLASCVLVR